VLFGRVQDKLGVVCMGDIYIGHSGRGEGTRLRKYNKNSTWVFAFILQEISKEKRIGGGGEDSRAKGGGSSIE